MFKSARWRSKKNKIKAVFELQFQATQVPRLKGKKKLMISLVPESVGKPTVKQRASIVEGTCSWENPIYETVKLIREPKTGNFKENIYYFIVSTGSSKSGFLGEISLDFADYAEATQPLLVSLPLNFSNSGVILHIGIQKMPGTEDRRDVEENEVKRTKSPDRSLQTQLVGCNTHGNNDLNFLEDEDLEISSPDAERIISFKDPQLENTAIPQDFVPVRRNSIPQKKTEDEVPTEKQVRQRSNADWSVGSASDRSMVDSTNSPGENFPRDESLEASNDSIEILKNEISMRDMQAELSGLELQSLRKQNAKESKRGQELSRQIVSLKEEYVALKTEYEQLKSSKKCIHEAEPRDASEDTRQQLKREKDLNKKLRLRLYETEDSNSELILVVSDLNKKLEQKNTEIHHLSSTVKATQNVKEDASETSIHDMHQEKDEQAPEELNNEDNNAKEEDLLKQITDLYGEIEVYRKDKEELKMLIEDLVVDYDVLKQENHNINSKLKQNQIEQMKLQSEYSQSLATIEEFKLQVDILEKQINKQVLEFSKSLNTMNELESQVKSLEKELEKQARDFEDDLEAETQAKVEQEQRAIRAEEALRKTRWSNANAAERLQDEFRRLSVDMASKLDENERLSMKTVAEANDLRLQKSVLEDMLQKANRELGLLKQQYEGKVQELLNRTNQQAKQIEQISQELEAKHNQIESFQKHEERKHSSDLQTFKAEIKILKCEKTDYHEEEEPKGNVKIEMEQLKKEREELEREFASATKEIEMLKEELSAFRNLKDEKGISAGTLKSEMDNLSIQYNELKHCMLQIDLEKETLRKQVFELEGELKKKDEVITNMDKKIQSNGEHAANSDTRGMTFKDAISALLPYPTKNTIILTEKMKSLEEAGHATDTRVRASKLKGGESTRENLHNSEIRPTAVTLRQNEVVKMAVKSGIETLSDGELKVPTCDPGDTSDLTKLLSEVSSLKEKNQHMEGELKEMQDKYSEISLKFAEVEGERQQLVMSLRNLKNGKKK